MRVVMMTNNYLPFVGGSALSVHRFSEKIRELGHQVLVVAPEYDDQPEGESADKVHRVAALKNFNQTGFSLPLPLHIDLLPRIAAFAPDIIHTHHPFLLGDAAANRWTTAPWARCSGVCRWNGTCGSTAWIPWWKPSGPKGPRRRKTTIPKS